MVLVDSSVWIDFWNGNEGPETRRLEILLEIGERICITQIILMEVLQGFRSERDFRRVRDHLADCIVLEPSGTQTYIDSARMYRLLRARGVTIRSSLDCLISSIAIEHDVIVLQKDRDFPRIAAHHPLQLMDCGDERDSAS